jgi:histidinol-phosphate aminotransferase
MFNLSSLVRPHIASLIPYSTARDEFSGEAEIYLDANENPYGSITDEAFNRYPDPYQTALKAKLAPIKNVRASQIFFGNGSDEPIDLLVRLFCRPQIDNMILLPPTYGMYQVSADLNDIAMKKVPLTNDFLIDTEKVLAAIDDHTKIIWICSPNNPSANLVQNTAIEQILTGFGGIVVVDEAYIDYTGQPSWNQRLDEFPNLVVLQTFSKAWGLAALRLGMAFASEEILRYMNKIKPPYNINGLTQQILFDALDKVDYVKSIVGQTITERELLAKELEELAIVEKIYPSDANFLLVKFNDSKSVFEYLLNSGVIVRDRSKVLLCENCLRITVGTATENEQMIAFLRKF